MPSTDPQDQPPKQGTPSEGATKAKTKAKGDGKRTVGEHGNDRFPEAKKGPIVDGVRRPHAERWKHACAAALHRWAEYAHHNSKEMRLSDEDYVAALDAVMKPDKKGIYTPHEAALYVSPTPKA